VLLFFKKKDQEGQGAAPTGNALMNKNKVCYNKSYRK